MRDEFPAAVKEILAKRVGYRCSNPSCQWPTSGPQEDPSRVVNVGVAAHITAATKGGPRYDETMSPEERRSESNGIWLCQKCGKLVDNDELRYPIEKLQFWKRTSEERAIREIEGIGTRDRTVSQKPDDLEKILRSRNLFDDEAPNFGVTAYSQKMGVQHRSSGTVESFPVVCLLFGHTREILIPDALRNKVFDWINANDRRYAPDLSHRFVPCLAPEIISRAHVWHDGHRLGHYPSSIAYSEYLAVEPEGYIEYGFLPGSLAKESRDKIYYAKIVARFLRFLRFMKELSVECKLGHDLPSVGMVLRSTKGRRLEHIYEQGQPTTITTTTPEKSGFLFYQQTEEAWSPEAVVRKAAMEILAAWSCSRPSWLECPEFSGTEYSGVQYRKYLVGS